MTTFEEQDKSSDFFDALSSWTGSDVTLYLLGRTLGLFEEDSFRTRKAVFYDMNPLESMLDSMVEAMVEVGLLERSPGCAYRTSPERLAYWRGFDNRQ